MRFAAYIKKEAAAPRFKTRLLLVALHALFLLALTIVLQYTSFVRYDEINFLKWAAVWKHDIFRSDEKPLSDHVVFLDVSKDLALAGDDEYGAPDTVLAGAQRVITDRAKLARLFSILNSHAGEYRYVICDVLFDKPGPGDSVLRPQIERLRNVVVSATMENGKLVKPIFGVEWAVVNYTAVNKGTFTKMPIYYNDTLKSLPAVLTEKTTSRRFGRSGVLTFLDGRPTFNTVIPEFYYRSVDLVRPDTGRSFNTFFLGELLADPDCFSALKDKIIIIGDFENDAHSTYMGRLAGSVILWDAYLTFSRNRIAISVGWLGMLFVFYFLISYWIVLHPDKKLKKIHEKIRLPFLSKFVISYISYIGMLLVINVFSYFFFGTFVSLFYIATYLTLLEWCIERLPNWKKSLYEYMMTS